MQGGLSKRAWGNVEDIMPRINAAVQERIRVDNPNIDLSTAENWLIRDEVIAIFKEAIAERLSAQDLSYPRAFAGFPEVLAAFASFFNSYFEPHTPVETSHLATAPGAASCIDTLLYNICDPGDGVLVPGPYWSMSKPKDIAHLLLFGTCLQAISPNRWLRFSVQGTIFRCSHSCYY